MATLTVKPSNTLKIKTQRVKKAYLAKKEIKGTEKTGETESYTFKGSNNTSTKARKEKIATIIYKNIKGGLQKKQQQTTVAHIVEVLKKDSYTKGDCIDIPLILPKIEFTKLANANLGDEVYMVVETENMANKRIKLSLKQAEKNCLVEKDSSIVLQQDGKKANVIETYVSRFAEQNKKNISNAEDFRNFAIDAVTLSPKDEKDQKKYREALNKTTDKKTKLFMVVDAESANQNWFEVKYEEIFDNRPNYWYYGEGNWFELVYQNTINIYHTGEISKLDFKGLKEVSYVYYDKDGGKHSLGNFDVIESQRWVDGTKHEWKTKKGGEWKKVTIGARTRYYKKDGNLKNPLITPFKGSPKVFKYSDSKNINFALYEDTSREYFNPEAFATLIGALAEVNYVDVVSNGSVATDGTGAYSVSHFNGFNMDFKYLRKDKKRAKIDKDSKGNKIPVIYVNNKDLDIERQNTFLDALHKFGWGDTIKNLSNKTHENKDLNHCKSDKHHKDHLHIQGLKIKYKK
ncbi:hypothetical protein [Tenacibaculum mesophilum]|uniref:hypothetical protein n=1 Tax=Tenacibaculum mesophilum TaxID=104268 RepID=UPI003F6344D3|nr:hypothetical protein BACY1_17180 [Tenacibaculum mesophilum]